MRTKVAVTLFAGAALALLGLLLLTLRPKKDGVE